MKTQWIRLATLMLTAGVLAAWGFSTTGCETTKGAGRDIQDAGEGMERAVEG